MCSFNSALACSALQAVIIIYLATPAFAQESTTDSVSKIIGLRFNHGDAKSFQRSSESSSMLPDTNKELLVAKNITVMGVNTPGTVRVNNLANMEAFLNIFADGSEIIGVAWGVPTVTLGLMHMVAGTQEALKGVFRGLAGAFVGLAVPGFVNWLVASARDANLFS